MAIKIIGAGFGRTGTNSCYVALRQLGFPCYHMLEVLENKANKSHLDFWCQVADSPAGSQHDWEQVFSNYTATLDNPASCVWRELMVACPDAKVLLTVHPGGADAWYRSTMETIYFTEAAWQFKLLALIVPFARKHGRMCHELVWQRSHQGTMSSRELAIAHYHRHVEEVKAAVPAERLLVFSADQGWEPLCRFLDVPLPDVPFPSVNDRAEFKARLTKLRLAAYALLSTSALCTAGLMYGVAQIMSR